MFLVDTAKAAADWNGVINTITKMLQKVDAEIVSIRKWDERKLAYPIKGQTRGTYILCYFRVDGRNVQDIEKAVRLSEQVIRVLILSAEHMTAEDIERDTPATKAEKEGTSRRDEPDVEPVEYEDDSVQEDDEEVDNTDDDEQSQDDDDEPDEDSDELGFQDEDEKD